jgi:Fe-S-cluster containining protein
LIFTGFNKMECRLGCGACCIAPSISSAIPGMPNGKQAGVRCIQLDEANLCKIFKDPARPACCSGLQASLEMCGENQSYALHWITELELATQVIPALIPAPNPSIKNN